VKRRHLLGLIVAASTLMPPAAGAEPITFFGFDSGLGELARLSSSPNADAARAAFMANLVGAGTEDFESYAAGTTAPLAIAFPGAGTATFFGDGSIASQPSGTNGFGRYPVSGSQFWDRQEAFSIAFSEPIAAFGFYGVDIGDFGGRMRLWLADGGSTYLDVPHDIDQAGGSVMYFGFYDLDQQFVGITFGDNYASGTDFFGLDDLTVASRAQVHPVPEPASALLVGLGLAGLAAVRRRRE